MSAPGSFVHQYSLNEVFASRLRLAIFSERNLSKRNSSLPVTLLTTAKPKDSMLTGFGSASRSGGLVDLGHRATIEDVAARAGVGVGTVSRVLNQQKHVSRVMREKVEVAIAELNYRPSRLARALSKGGSDIVSIVAPYITRPSVVARIDSCLAGLNRVGIVASLFGVFNRAQFDQVIDTLSDRHSTMALVVVSIPVTDAQARGLRSANVNLVGLDIDVAGSDSVFVDNIHGGEIVGTHLLSRGYHQIGFIGDADSGKFQFTSTDARLCGLRSALRQGGSSLEIGHIKLCEHGTSQAKECAMELLTSNRPPDAIFASSDTGALGVLSAANELGVRVPEDLGVVGFDNLEMAAVVGLSSVLQPLSLSGEIVAERLIMQLTQSDAHPVHTMLDLELVERTSTSRVPNLVRQLQPTT